ncbi:uncharacterized protein LOC112529118 [Cynara cardunculus var. scolymus]|uniref:uncharacterized protein LOC112529118 n=1 Tax=Cynara cardunculus var. scolymus TaxID=59895 RepID=UPI000D630C62|nr:uncharacterized protein LOC112529118 [Cynara cardunculus var. scolymus]
MGFGASFVACCVTLCWLCSLKGIQSTDNSTLRSLDDIFQVYAQSSLPRRPRTGVLYNASLPSNFTGIEVSIVRLRRGSFWAKGANYSSFRLPPKIFTEPYSTRLDIVYSDLGNESSHYYSVPNYTLVAPVVGFNIYGSRNSTGQIGNFTTPVTKLNLTLVGGPILVQFPKISLPQNEKPKCVRFYLDGTVEMTNMTLQNMCIVQDQGHFSIVIRTSPPIQQAPKENKERVKGLWKWWAMGFGIGVFGLLLLGFIIFIIIRIFRMRKIGKMEKESQRNEDLDTTNVGHSRMPSASLIRTQPNIENDYFP